MYKAFFKRLFDVLGAIILFILLSPLLITVTIWLHFANKGAGAFFCQERPGKDEKIFKLYKFKSMTDERDANGELLSDAERITKVGRFIRKTSIDELPQLWNILKGDMSFIGPRPLLPRYIPYYTDVERQRHNVSPGITGWAQVNGRNNLPWNKRLGMDVFYVNNITFAFDLKIFIRTLLVVFKRSDISVIPPSTSLDEERDKYVRL